MELASLCALEASWDLLATIVKQQAKTYGNIEVNSQDIGFNGSAKANCSFKIDKTINETAARVCCRGAHDYMDQAEQVSANAQLESVCGAMPLVVVGL